MTRFLPQRVPIEQFGAGGFRFGGMSHQGGLLVLPSGMRAWNPVSVGDIAEGDLAGIIAERDAIDFLLIGTGPSMMRLPTSVLGVLTQASIAFEAMATSPAVHVYNVTVGEGRRVAAAFLPVEHANA